VEGSCVPDRAKHARKLTATSCMDACGTECHFKRVTVPRPHLSYDPSHQTDGFESPPEFGAYGNPREAYREL
jgi:hypothetical protein